MAGRKRYIHVDYEGIILRCYKCGYIWHTRSKMHYVTCPCCHRKISLQKALENPDEPIVVVVRGVEGVELKWLKESSSNTSNQKRSE